MKVVPFLIIFLVGCAHNSGIKEVSTMPHQPSWIKSSNEVAEKFSKELALIYPETGSEIGFSEFDSKGLLLDSQIDIRTRNLFLSWVQNLDFQIQTTNDPELKTDYKVLKQWLQTQIASMDVAESEHEIEFQPATEIIYKNLQVLINQQSSADRKKAAVDRFKVYVRGDANHEPLLVALETHFENLQKKFLDKAFLPYSGKVEAYLKDTGSYVAGIEDMLKLTNRNDWNDDFVLFKKQVSQYDNFVKFQVLPISNKDPRQPPAMYAQILERRQIHKSPSELIKVGLRDYKKVYAEFKTQAQLVAKLNNFKNANPASVIQNLKKNKVTSAQDVEKLYQTSAKRLEEIILKHNLISLPNKPLVIRVAGDAESRSVPVPHLTQPPFINNKGERPEFVVPSLSGEISIDDFLSSHAAMVLTAHEGRPGHDLQFSAILDNGISLIRGMYAANNVNVEGWALYAEDLVFPYISAEEKLFALQTRLWRIARMFLDPQIQLGKIPEQRVIDLFTKELGVSEAMAKLELNRYKFRDIGQAPSYYEGYLIVKNMRAEHEQKQGVKFNLKCFNDRLISFGLLPLSLIQERMRTENFVCR